VSQLSASTFVEMRKHPRAQLGMPARIRWRGPLGMRMEITRTIDVSRDGVRVPRSESCEIGSRVWLTFPFDSTASAAVQPETPAHVVRVERNSQRSYDVSLQLEMPPRNGERAKNKERRSCSRITFAIPMFVRAAGSPWPEESMTNDISRAGARFESALMYNMGDTILAKIPWGEWERAGEIRARVVRVEAGTLRPGPAPQSNPAMGKSGMLSFVSVSWIAPPKV